MAKNTQKKAKKSTGEGKLTKRELKLIKAFQQEEGGDLNLEEMLRKNNAELDKTLAPKKSKKQQKKKKEEEEEEEEDEEIEDFEDDEEIDDDDDEDDDDNDSKMNINDNNNDNIIDNNNDNKIIINNNNNVIMEFDQERSNVMTTAQAFCMRYKFVVSNPLFKNNSYPLGTYLPTDK